MVNVIKFSPELEKATGPLEFNMTNDVLFKTVLQRDERVLKGLISAVLHIPLDDIYEIHIENTEEFKDRPSDKKFLLDVNVLVNNSVLLNLEMQVVHFKFWKERSLSYLCRKFDNLQKGQSYNIENKVIHIGFLDFDLFPEYPEFYSKFKMINERFNYVFNDKFDFRVLSLGQTDIATEEDKYWGIDKWAKLFKATTYEEIKMLAEKKEELAYAAEQIMISNSDEWEIERMRRRADDLRIEQSMKEELASFKAEIAENKSELAKKDAALAEKEAENIMLREEINRLKSGK